MKYLLKSNCALYFELVI